MCFCSSPKRLEWPHPELVHWWLLDHSSQFADRRSSYGNEFLVPTESFSWKPSPARKRGLLFSRTAERKGGKTESVGLRGLHSFVVVHVARECPTAAALYLDLAHPVCSAHKVESPGPIIVVGQWETIISFYWRSRRALITCALFKAPSMFTVHFCGFSSKKCLCRGIFRLLCWAFSW